MRSLAGLVKAVPGDSGPWTVVFWWVLLGFPATCSSGLLMAAKAAPRSEHVMM